MNKAIRATSILALLMTIVLLVNLTNVHMFSHEKYAENEHNQRHYILLAKTPRGQITTSPGGSGEQTVLAQSLQDADGHYQRQYPTFPIAYGPITGYLSDIYGATGLESSYQSLLSGTDDALLGENWADRLAGKPTPGASVELTLAPTVQQVAYDELTKPGYEGAVVAIKPSTGAILAMASTPSFDPSNLANDDTATDYWQQINNAEGSPLLNHATQETLPPGSTFKVITTAAALASGVKTSDAFTAAPQITLPDGVTTLENYAGTRCGGGSSTTLATAFALSCNTAFAELGMKIGAEKLMETAINFGVTDSYNLGIPMSPGTTGAMTDQPSVAQSSIGQRDVTMTVLQNAVVAAAVANKGVRMQPYLVSKVTGSDLKTVRETKPRSLGEAVSPEIATQLTELMKASERNTKGYTGQNIASKTGTAEHGADSRGSNPHAWYIAFVPGGDVAVAVVVKNGGNQGQAATGGSVAAPIGRAVLQAATALNLPAAEEQKN